MALGGRPTVHVIRFQSFNHYHATPLVFYAAKAKELWGYELPLLVRTVASDGIGPVHSGTHISQFLHYPGLAVAAPVTPSEYREVWEWWRQNRCPVVVSEHKSTFDNGELATGRELKRFRVQQDEPDVTLVAVSYARMAAIEAAKKLWEDHVYADVIGALWLSPIDATLARIMESVKRTKRAVIVDTEYAPCGVAEHLACLVGSLTENCRVRICTPEFKSSGVASQLRNDTPGAEEIVKAVHEVL
jgi:pyruvate/2-oxoglutarate/acetoin dehydrogenase E1 component